MSKVLHQMTVIFYLAAGMLVALAIRDHWRGNGRTSLPRMPKGDASRGENPMYEIGLDGNRRGPDDAEVTLIVFSNYDCSHCASFERTLEALLHRYPDQVAVVTKHFESSGRRVSVEVEAAADCAAQQGRFAAYHRGYLLNTRRAISREPWRDIGREIALSDSLAFQQCVRAGRFNAKVVQQTQQGHALGVDGTPTTFVNGVRVVGDAPFGAMDKLVADMLRRRSPASIAS